MNPFPGWDDRMTYRASFQGTVISLKLIELDTIVCFPAGRHGMRAVVTGLTIETAMSLGETI
jgi:hypothetical protein